MSATAKFYNEYLSETTLIEGESDESLKEQATREEQEHAGYWEAHDDYIYRLWEREHGI